MYFVETIYFIQKVRTCTMFVTGMSALFFLHVVYMCCTLYCTCAYMHSTVCIKYIIYCFFHINLVIILDAAEYQVQVHQSRNIPRWRTLSSLFVQVSNCRKWEQLEPNPISTGRSRGGEKILCLVLLTKRKQVVKLLVAYRCPHEENSRL
jgi:hypothetical protein